MKARVLCYLPAIDGTPLDNGIDVWSRLWNLKAPKELRCSHSEVWTPGELGLEQITAEGVRAFLGDCYTSTMRKHDDGVCKNQASWTLRNPDRWNFFELEIRDVWYHHFIREMETKVANNQGYDKWTIASYFWYKRLGNPSKFICSEFVHLSILPYVEGKVFRNLVALNCPSPIRLAYALWRSGLDLYSLKTGNVILKGQDDV